MTDSTDPVYGEQALTDPLTKLPYMDLVQTCRFSLMNGKIPGTDSYDQHVEAEFIRRWQIPGVAVPDQRLPIEWLNLSDVIHDSDVQTLAYMMKKVLYRYHTGDLRKMGDILAEAEAARAAAEEEARLAAEAAAAAGGGEPVAP